MSSWSTPLRQNTTLALPKHKVQIALTQLQWRVDTRLYSSRRITLNSGNIPLYDARLLIMSLVTPKQPESLERGLDLWATSNPLKFLLRCSDREILIFVSDLQFSYLNYGIWPLLHHFECQNIHAVPMIMISHYFTEFWAAITSA